MGLRNAFKSPVAPWWLSPLSLAACASFTIGLASCAWGIDKLNATQSSDYYYSGYQTWQHTTAEVLLAAGVFACFILAIFAFILALVAFYDWLSN